MNYRPLNQNPWFRKKKQSSEQPQQAFTLVSGKNNQHLHPGNCNPLAFHNWYVKLVINDSSLIGLWGYRVFYAVIMKTVGMKLLMVAKKWKSMIYSTSAPTYLWDLIIYLYAQFLILDFQRVVQQCVCFPPSLEFEARKPEKSSGHCLYRSIVNSISPWWIRIHYKRLEDRWNTVNVDPVNKLEGWLNDGVVSGGRGVQALFQWLCIGWRHWNMWLSST